jgi:hypothetical protein
MEESNNLDQIGEKLKQLQDQGLSNANATQVKSFIDIRRIHIIYSFLAERDGK